MAARATTCTQSTSMLLNRRILAIQGDISRNIKQSYIQDRYHIKSQGPNQNIKHPPKNEN